MGVPRVAHDFFKFRVLKFPTENVVGVLIAGNRHCGISRSPVTITHVQLFTRNLLHRLDDLTIRGSHSRP